ncbi:choice-of-anchor M domain-containing protein [Corynebacterium sp. HMSC04H06]|uniref:choice-of-anchor M domain-containing protein n=1 Tax=Corynebacterium sp. HMSC04H06 TaxID=1581050 RepID=UPI0008A40F4E|nr:choice-of-anchor M domain-containing protein [Corynebacterium sp. HMSC04H06]OFS19078.1 hypothetical protein HMPREF3067_10395 [Corynebacterium sp. HMSC04H06]
MAKFRRRCIALLLTPALLSPATALAGPDDGKIVATQTHIDSPKTFWENDSFALKSEFHRKAHPLDQTVAWVGKGWAAGSGQQQYQFQLPEDDSFSFAGKPGDVVYNAPANPRGNHDPIWMGFGSDRGLPVADFRGNVASLDLVSVDGPGDFELYNWLPGQAPERIFGSFADSAHSTPLEAGTHTHNHMLFTKPGRYEITYRTTARTAAGKLVASQPTTTSIQVGGQGPLDDPTEPLEQRYRAAGAGDRDSLQSAGYHLRVSPKTEKDKDGDENLTTLGFRAEQPVDGTLTVFHDGYFLTDLPVKGGRAQFDELLGAGDSRLQAVFVPDGDSAPRWVSDVIATTAAKRQGESRASTTEHSQEPSAWEVASQPRGMAATTEATVSDQSAKVRVEPAANGQSRLVIDTADPHYTGFITGGMYSSKDDELPIIDFHASVTAGHGEYYFKKDWDGDDTLKLKFTPHPLVTDLSPTEAVITEDYSPTGTFEKTVSLAGADAARPTPGVPGQTPARCGERYLLDKGHVDVAASPSAEGFDVGLKDDTGLTGKKDPVHRLDEVVLGVRENAQRTRTLAMADKALDFMGPVGKKFFLLPQTQKDGVIWPGYNTEALDYSAYAKGSVTLELDPVHVPDGASWGLFTNQGLGSEVAVLADSRAKDTTVETQMASHVHANWAFSTPGWYQFAVSFRARTTDGREVSSRPQVLSFAVGDDAIDDCVKNGAPDQGSQPNPDPKPEPEPKPDPRPQPGPHQPGTGDVVLSSFQPLALFVPLAVLGVVGAAVSFVFRHVPGVATAVERFLAGLGRSTTIR